MPIKTHTVDPRVLYGIPVIVAALVAVAVLPPRVWLAGGAAALLTAAMALADARRGNPLGLPETKFPARE